LPNTQEGNKIKSDITNCLRSYNNFGAKPPFSANFVDNFGFYFGYLLFAGSVVYIGWSSLCKSCSATKTQILITFGIAYLPISCAVLIEVAARLKFGSIRRQALKLRADAMVSITR